MKNNLIILISIIFFFSKSAADTFIFETKNLEISETENLIIANEGKVVSVDNDLEINAKKFEYYKNKDQLIASGNGKAYIFSKNLEISFDQAIFDQSKLMIIAKNNVQIDKIDKKLSLTSNEVIINRSSNIIRSNVKTKISDKFKNIYIADKVRYEVDNSLLKITNLETTDIYENNLKTSLAFINIDTNKLIGKDVNINLNDQTLGKKNQPRLKGNNVISNTNITKINKGIFTTCKKNDNCPSWQISAKNIKHDKLKKTIFYDDAYLSFYNKPVLYFPKFFHPDPTVKRQSGFLMPAIKNSTNSSDYLNIPYFLAISESKDATFNPRFYLEDKFLLQTEYRQVNSDSRHQIDTSLFSQKNKNNENHFFYDFNKSLNISNFDSSLFNFKLQKTSNDTYLKNNKLDSDIIQDKDILENSLSLKFYSSKKSLDFDMQIYENLNKNNNDRYEYIFPKYNYYQKLENKTSLNGKFSFNSNGLVKKNNTNILEKKNVNDLRFESYPNKTNSGFYNNYEFLIRNSITDAKNSISYKNKENLYLSSIFQFNSSLPLIKENEKYQKILRPKLSLKLAPEHTKDERNKDMRIDINDVYSIERLSNDSTIEGGASITYGLEFINLEKRNSKDLFNFKIANNIRLEENEDLPKSNQLNQKTSDIFNEISYNFNDNINTKYISSVKNNLSDVSYENLILQLASNKIITTFDYLNNNNSLDKNSYLSSSINYKIDDFNNISFLTRKNKKEDITEYYKLMYQFKNDCLSASIIYNKDFYVDRDMKQDESLLFKIAIIPFAQTSSPNLK